MKIKNNKAFTLMELLAVIVILAILALIVTPIILNIINKSQQGSDERSLSRYAEVVKQDFFETKLMDSSLTFEDYLSSDAVASISYIGNKVVCEEYDTTNTNDIILKKCTVDGRGYYSYINGVAKKDKDKPADKDDTTNNGNKPNEDNNTNNGGNEGDQPNTPPQDTTKVCLITEENADGTLTIDEYNINECSKDVVIPSYIGGKKVTAIGEFAFGEVKITSVVLPDTLERIEDYAFWASNITNVDIPDGVKIIGDYAFSGTKLKNVVIPDSVTEIGNVAFGRPDHNECYLENVVIGNSVKNIGSYAFNKCKLTNVIIPDSVTTIGAAAFKFNNITSITIGNSITSIGKDAFNINNITSVTINNLKSNVTLEESAFGYFDTNKIIWNN